MVGEVNQCLKGKREKNDSKERKRQMCLWVKVERKRKVSKQSCCARQRLEKSRRRKSSKSFEVNLRKKNTLTKPFKDVKEKKVKIRQLR